MRFYCEENLTPIMEPIYSPSGTLQKLVRNSDLHDDLIKLGYEQYFMIYNQTLARSLLWDGQSGPPSGVILNWNDPSLKENLYAPPNMQAVQACAKLAANPSIFQATSKSSCPIVFDIEGDGSTQYNNTMYMGFGSDQNEAKVATTNVLNTIRYVRTVNQSSPIYWFGLIPPPFDAALTNQNFHDNYFNLISNLQPISDELSGACCCLYFWDAVALNPSVILSEIKQNDSILSKYFPNLYKNRVATITPAYQIYWDNNIKKLNGTPIPINIWKYFIDYLKDDGWDIMIWTQDLTFEPFAKHCEYIAKVGKNI